MPRPLQKAVMTSVSTYAGNSVESMAPGHVLHAFGPTLNVEQWPSCGPLPSIFDAVHLPVVWHQPHPLTSEHSPHVNADPHVSKHSPKTSKPLEHEALLSIHAHDFDAEQYPQTSSAAHDAHES